MCSLELNLHRHLRVVACALLLFVLALAATARGQAEGAAPAATAGDQVRGVSLGMDVLRLQDDFGVGLRLGTPFFLHDSLRVTVAGGVGWFPHDVTASGDQQWRTYGQTRLVLEAGRRIEGLPIRLYGFGGVLLLILPDALSSNAVAPGGVGGFGFEFYMPRTGRDGPVSYLLELGGMGTGASATRVPGQPSIGNGFFLSAGLRWYLTR